MAAAPAQAIPTIAIAQLLAGCVSADPAPQGPAERWSTATAALGAASIAWQTPKDGAVLPAVKGQTVSVVATYAAAVASPFEVHCYADGQLAAIGWANTCTFQLGAGWHVLAAVLAANAKVEFGGTAATAILHVAVSLPCAAAADCSDGNPCAIASCSAGMCAYAPVAGCCVADQQCAVADPCRKGFCVDHVCRSGKDPAKPNCCSPLNNPTCSDGNACTTDQCASVLADGAGTCVHGPVFGQPGVCCDESQIEANANCDDQKPCTADLCEANTCKHLAVAGCCQTAADCDDGQPCTLDTCQAALPAKVGKCAHAKTCCTGPADCDDGKACTIDVCEVGGICKHYAFIELNVLNGGCCDAANPCVFYEKCSAQIACVNQLCVSATDGSKGACCQTAVDCNDSKPCTKDECLGPEGCSHANIPGCCLDDADALNACSDGNPCTVEYCLNNQCRHTVPKGGCCHTWEDCLDGDPCTQEYCLNIVAGKGQCWYGWQNCPKDTCSPINPASWSNDNNPCTQESCAWVGGQWTIVKQWKVPGCCVNSSDCNDGKAATTDVCVLNECLNLP